MLPEVIGTFRKTFPGIRVHFTDDPTARLEQLVIDKLLDFYFGPKPSPSSGLNFEIVAVDDYAVMAMEALRKLINGEIRSQARINVVQTRAFSEHLGEAIARYHANAITTAEVIQELIRLARDIQAARRRGEEEGPSPEEVAFYDALAQNESAVEVMGDDRLRVIAHELLNNLKGNAPVDWQHRESARARMRVLVKRILRKYGYLPDLQDAGVQVVLQQAEILAERWAA